jgi:CheY-like chemotaxis protein
MAKILLIEDDSQLVKLYQGKLEDVGYEVMIAVNGFDVLERLKSDTELKKIPVFVLTNLDSEEKVAKEIGAMDYIVKVHVDPKDVVEKIKRVLK